MLKNALHGYRAGAGKRFDAPIHSQRLFSYFELSLFGGEIICIQVNSIKCNSRLYHL